MLVSPEVTHEALTISEFQQSAGSIKNIKRFPKSGRGAVGCTTYKESDLCLITFANIPLSGKPLLSLVWVETAHRYGEIEA